MTYKSISLSEATWDLYLDDSGNLAIKNDAYAVAQDVATALMTVKGEHVFNNQIGIPMFDQILGHQPGIAYVENIMELEAKTINSVDYAKATISSEKDRKYSGIISIVDNLGTQSTVTI